MEDDNLGIIFNPSDLIESVKLCIMLKKNDKNLHRLHRILEFQQENEDCVEVKCNYPFYEYEVDLVCIPLLAYHRSSRYRDLLNNTGRESDLLVLTKAGYLFYIDKGYFEGTLENDELKFKTSGGHGVTVDIIEPNKCSRFRYLGVSMSFIDRTEKDHYYDIIDSFIHRDDRYRGYNEFEIKTIIVKLIQWGYLDHLDNLGKLKLINYAKN